MTARSPVCLNCGAQLSGSFCASCRTLLKELAIGAIYAVTATLAFIVMIYWVSIAA